MDLTVHAGITCDRVFFFNFLERRREKGEGKQTSEYKGGRVGSQVNAGANK